MQLDLSVPKKNAVSVADGEDGLLLCSAREGMERALSAAAGRALVLADGSSFSSFIPASRAANTVCMLWDGDALGLFALPEVRSVLVSGGRDAVEGARFFAAVRRIPCTVFAKDAAMDGIFSPRARVKVNGCCPDVPLAPAGSEFRQAVWKILCDIPYGQLTTYGQIALLCGKPRNAR